MSKHVLNTRLSCRWLRMEEPCVDGERIVDQLYRRDGAALARSLTRGGASREDAADGVHSLFLRFLGRVRSGPIGSPAAYLQTMAVNQRVSAARARQREHDVRERLIEAEVPVVDAVRELEARDLLRRIESALLRLKPRTRAIFLAHRVEGLSYSEIGERHGLSVKGVEKQMSKAIAHLDRWLERNGE